MKRIVILANKDRGLYIFRKELIQELIQQKFEVFIALPYGDLVEKLINMGCQFFDTPFDRKGTNPIADMGLLLQYNKILNLVKPDIVLTYTIKPNVYGGLLCRLKHIPYLTNVTGLGSSMEDNGLMSKLTLLLSKIGLSGAHTVFFQNKSNQDYFVANKIVKGRTKLIPGSGVNLSEHLYEEYPPDNGIIRFLYIGRLMKNKGMDELLECAGRIKKKYTNVQFSILGDYDEPIYKEKLERLQQQGILKYYGYQNDVDSFIKSHHATILPSYHEGLSNVLLETAACGRPVIASNVPGCRETFEEGLSGIGFQAKSTDDLYRAVETFIQLPYEKKKRMGENARQKVEREFSRDIVIQAYLKEIDNIVNKEFD